MENEKNRPPPRGKQVSEANKEQFFVITKTTYFTKRKKNNKEEDFFKVKKSILDNYTILFLFQTFYLYEYT